jgi:hypothetical protein
MHAFGADPIGDPISVGVGIVSDTRPRHRAVRAYLGPSMAADQVGGDAVEPGTTLGPVRS